jgi:hypothetical protein
VFSENSSKLPMRLVFISLMHRTVTAFEKIIPVVFIVLLKILKLVRDSILLP